MQNENNQFLNVYKEFILAHKHMTSVIHKLDALVVSDFEKTNGGAKGLLLLQISDAEKKLNHLRKIIDQKF
jgi:hypothetical protein